MVSVRFRELRKIKDPKLVAFPSCIIARDGNYISEQQTWGLA